MPSKHPKSVRRKILTFLYERYQQDPMEMLSPHDLMADARIEKQDLITNIYYLSDRGLVEVMMGYSPPLFAATRITANGIDLVENHFEFNLRFPAAPGEVEAGLAEIPHLMERLVEEADFAPVDGEVRRALLRDVQYLRDELARPATRWRRDVIESVLDWMAAHVEEPDEHLPSLGKLRERVRLTLSEP